MPDNLPITCISSGPLVEALGNGVHVFDATDKNDAFVKAMQAMPDVMQCIAVDPFSGIKRDYRRARMDDVCGSLLRSGIAYRL